MNKIILADSQSIFRAGAAKLISSDPNFRIVAQCSDTERMMHAITTFPGSLVVFGSLLKPDLPRLAMLLETMGSRGIAIAELSESASTFLAHGIRGVMLRNSTGGAMIECIRRVASGEISQPQQAPAAIELDEDMVGRRVRDRLTPKEMRIVALIVQGCKNREIAFRLKTTEQVVKNYLRSIYDKTGVSDRLELALFTLHHRVLAEAAADVGSIIEKEEREASLHLSAHADSAALHGIDSRQNLEATVRTGTWPEYTV